jgi:MFS family permease
MLFWFLCLAGASIIYTLYPVMMPEVFGIGQKRLSLAYAVAIGLTAILFPLSGRCAHRFGAANVITTSMGARLFALVTYFLLVSFRFDGSSQLILLTFTAIVISWPFLMVSSTTLTAVLSPKKEGIRMGIFNAISTIGFASGSLLGGWLAGTLGYHASCGTAIITEILGLILIFRIRHTHGRLPRSSAKLLHIPDVYETARHADIVMDSVDAIQ